MLNRLMRESNENCIGKTLLFRAAYEKQSQMEQSKTRKILQSNHLFGRSYSLKDTGLSAIPFESPFVPYQTMIEALLWADICAFQELFLFTYFQEIPYFPFAEGCQRHAPQSGPVALTPLYFLPWPVLPEPLLNSSSNIFFPRLPSLAIAAEAFAF